MYLHIFNYIILNVAFSVLSRNSGFGPSGGTVFRLDTGCMLSTADAVVLPDQGQ